MEFDFTAMLAVSQLDVRSGKRRPPRSIYLHASHIVDGKVFLLNRAVTALGLFNVVAFNALIASAISERLTPGDGAASCAPGRQRRR